MRIVLEATRDEYVAWLRQQPYTDRYTYTDYGNPLSRFVQAWIAAQDTRDHRRMAITVQLYVPVDDGMHTAYMVVCVGIASERGRIENEFPVAIPAWMQPLVVLYMPEHDGFMSPAGAIADAEALADNDEPPPSPDRIIFRSGGGATSRDGGIA